MEGELVVDSEARVETVLGGEQSGKTQVVNQDQRKYGLAVPTDGVVIARSEHHLVGLRGTDVPFANWMTGQLAGDVSELQAELALAKSLAPAA